MAKDAGVESVNLAQLHYQLLNQMFKAPDSLLEFCPTNKNVEKSPAPFVDLKGFPSTEFDHKNFFYHHEICLHDKQVTITRSTHCYFCRDRIDAVKKKICLFLYDNSIFIDSEEIKATKTTAVAWFLHAHASMTQHPTLTARAQAVLQELLLDEDLKAHLKRLYPEEDVCLPEANWMVQFPNLMSVNAVALCCSRQSLGVVKKLLPLTPPGSF